jgi:hypothetical protein
MGPSIAAAACFDRLTSLLPSFSFSLSLSLSLLLVCVGVCGSVGFGTDGCMYVVLLGLGLMAFLWGFDNAATG